MPRRRGSGQIVDKTGLIPSMIVGTVIGVMGGGVLAQTCLPMDAAIVVGVLLFGSAFVSHRWTCPECHQTYKIPMYRSGTRYRCQNRACGMMFCVECKQETGECCPRCGNSVRTA